MQNTDLLETNAMQSMHTTTNTTHRKIQLLDTVLNQHTKSKLLQMVSNPRLCMLHEKPHCACNPVTHEHSPTMAGTHITTIKSACAIKINVKYTANH